MNTEEVEAVAPLDAYATAKPDEPTFTLQGGDPLGGPLVRAWALLARRRAGIARFEQTSFSELIEAAIGNTVEEDDREHESLLIRATAAEAVSWAMDAYRKGNHRTEQPVEEQHTHLTALERIDLYDLRVRVAGKLSNFRSEIHEMREALAKRGFTDEETLQRMADVADTLKVLNEAVEYRRMFKKDPS